MKKRICAIVLLGVVLLSSVVAKDTISNAKEKEKTEQESIKSFEQITELDNWRDIYACKFTTYFGRANLNKKSDYITQGKGSMKFQVYGDFLPNGGINPEIEIALSDEKYTDISRIRSISFDIFNETGKKSRVGVSLAIDNMNTVYEYFDLEEGKNQITVEYNAKGMSGGYDLTKGESLCLKFDKAKNDKEGKKNVYYLDNVAMNMSLIAPKPYEITFDEGELCSYDKNYQEFVTTVGGISTTTDYPIVEVNKDRAYCMDMKGRSLKVTLPSASGAVTGNTKIELLNSIWEHYDWTQLGKENKELVFDVYNDNSISIQGTFTIWPEHLSDAYRWSQSFTMAPREWTTVRVPISEWNKLSRDGGEVAGAKHEPLKEEKEWLMSSEQYRTPFIVFRKFVGEDRVLYFDNFRIENSVAQ